MASIVNNLYLFILIKLIGISVIIMILSKMYKQNKAIASTGMKLLIVMMLFVVGNNLFVINANAVDNTISNPVCINPSYDTSYPLFLITSGGGGVNTTSVSNGFFSLNQRFYNGAIVCAVSDTSTSGAIAGQQRLVGRTATAVFYWDVPLDNYALGYYNPSSNPTGMTYLIGTVTSAAVAQIAVDSGGNVYTMDGLNIIKYVKSSDYSQSLFYTLTANTDFTPASNVGGTLTTLISSMKFDSSGNLHVLIDTLAYNNGCSGAFNGYLSRTVISPQGVRVKSDLTLQASSGMNAGGCNGGYIGGGLILDSVNPLSNFTYTYYVSQLANSGVYLKHNSSSGTTDIFGGVLTGITSVSGISFSGFTVFLASPSQNLVRTYLTNYTGYNIPVSVNGAHPALTYSLAFVNSVYPTYYNNSIFSIDFQVAYTANASQTTTYSHRIDLYAPDGGVVGTYPLTRVCEDIGVLDWLLYPTKQYNCIAVTHTININDFIANPQGALAGATNIQFSSISLWNNGSYTVKLMEVPSNAILATNTFAVLNLSGQLTSGSNPPPSVTAGTAPKTISLIDGFVGMLGMGVNAVSKLLFALIVIALAMLAGFIATGREVFGGVIIGLIPYLFFTFIEYLPVWGVVILGIVVAIKIGFFR